MSSVRFFLELTYTYRDATFSCRRATIVAFHSAEDIKNGSLSLPL